MTQIIYAIYILKIFYSVNTKSKQQKENLAITTLVPLKRKRERVVLSAIRSTRVLIRDELKISDYVMWWDENMVFCYALSLRGFRKWFVLSKFLITSSLFCECTLCLYIYIYYNMQYGDVINHLGRWVSLKSVQLVISWCPKKIFKIKSWWVKKNTRGRGKIVRATEPWLLLTPSLRP